MPIKGLKPLTAQLEITYACNNACAFCYNRWNAQKTGELTAQQWKTILKDLHVFGLFSVNFNGGEPFMRDDFFDLAEFAVGTGLDIHCNTNCTLITKSVAKRIARLFPAICTSLHGDSAGFHDKIVGRYDAFNETVKGIRNLIAEGVYVAVNITLSQKNAGILEAILHLLRSLAVGTVLLSRVLTNDKTLSVSDKEMMNAILTVKEYQEKTNAFARIGFPQPIPPCKCNDASLKEFICQRNVACAAGITTVRITPDGFVTPCPVLKRPVIGNVKEQSFSELWRKFDEGKWRKKAWPGMHCNTCNALESCGKGCMPQDERGCLLPYEEA